MVLIGLNEEGHLFCLRLKNLTIIIFPKITNVHIVKKPFILVPTFSFFAKLQLV